MSKPELLMIVSNSQELSKAVSLLSSGTGGRILVERGTEAYELSRFKTGPQSGEIVITAADPEDPPIFTQVKLIESQNMTFSGLIFDGTNTDNGSGKDLEILDSDNITVENSIFRSEASGYFDGTDPNQENGGNLGLVRDSDNFTFSGNDVANYFHGLALIESIGSRVIDNNFSHLVGDGLRMSGVQNTLVENNHFSATYGSAQNINHTDMIQVWSAPYNQLNTENLVIRGNVLNSSGGVGSQSIFIRNETFPNTLQKFENITVENNTIYNGHLHGVTIYDTVGVNVSNNTLLWNADAKIKQSTNSDGVTSAPTIRLYGVENGVVTGNITSGIYAPDAVRENNVFLEYTDVTSSNFVGAHFINAFNAGDVDLRDLKLKSDSPWVGQFGSEHTQPGTYTDVLTPIIQQVQSYSDHGLVIYDASLSVGPDGALDANATYHWSFSDGTVLAGRTVAVQFDDPGLQEVTLTIQAGADSASVTRTTYIEPDTLVSIDFNGEPEDSSSFESVLTDVGTRVVVEGVGGDGFHLGGSNKLRIESENAQLYNLPSFTISMGVKRDPGGDEGIFLHMHRGLNASITKDGALELVMRTVDGVFTATTAPGLISTDQWHHLSMTFDGVGGEINLYVDGVLAGNSAVTGSMSVESSPYDLVLGNTWNDSLQGTIDMFSMTRSVADAGDVAYQYETMSALLSGEPQPPFEPILSPGPEPMPPLEPILSPEPTQKDWKDSSPMDDASLLHLDFNGGAQDSSSSQSALRVVNSEQTARGVTDDDFVLDGKSKIYLLRSNSALEEAETFTMALSLSLSDPGQSGVFLHMHRALIAEVTETGAVQITIRTDEGLHVLGTADGLISDTGWHRLAISYDGTEKGEGLSLYLDGFLVGHEAVSGALNDDGSYHLVLGNTWKDSIEARVDDFAIDHMDHHGELFLEDYHAKASDFGQNLTMEMLELNHMSESDKTEEQGFHNTSLSVADSFPYLEENAFGTVTPIYPEIDIA